MPKRNPKKSQPHAPARAIAEGVLEDLRALGRAENGESASKTFAALRGVADALREAGDEARARTAETYRERSLALVETAERRAKRVEAYARRLRREVPASPDAFVLAGRVTDGKSGLGIPNVQVRAVEPSNARSGARTAEPARTDALGYFRIQYGPDRLEAAGRRGDIAVEVLDPAGKRLGTSRTTVRARKGKSEFVPVEIDGARVPELLGLAGAVDRSVEDRLDRFRNVKRRETDNPVADGVKLPKPAVERPAPSIVSPRALAARPPSRGHGPEPRARLEDIPGIGPAYAKRLAQNGLPTVADVASASSATLAKVLRLTEDRAARLIEQAKHLTRRR